jgi:DNA-binding NarL/FixJ family response regulator
VRVLLADDDPKVRSALRLLLENEPGITIAGECAAADELVEQVLRTSADMVLLDWGLPELRASGAVDHLRAANSACQIVALSASPEDRADALQAGVDRFVCKGDAPETLLLAVREVRESFQLCGPLAPSNA